MRKQSLMFSVLLVMVSLMLSASFLAARNESEDNPAVVQAVPPAYPPIARAAQVSGEVVAEATVDPDGAVTSVNITKGHKLLNGAVEKAAARWKFDSLKGGTKSRKVHLVFQFTLIPANKGTPDDLGAVFWPPYKVEVRDSPYRVD